jgi:hypothetical protein
LHSQVQQVVSKLLDELRKFVDGIYFLKESTPQA